MRLVVKLLLQFMQYNSDNVNQEAFFYSKFYFDKVHVDI